jgi:hypothetical protein
VVLKNRWVVAATRRDRRVVATWRDLAGANEGAVLNATDRSFSPVKFEFFGDDRSMAEMVRHVEWNAE